MEITIGGKLRPILCKDRNAGTPWSLLKLRNVRKIIAKPEEQDTADKGKPNEKDGYPFEEERPRKGLLPLISIPFFVIPAQAGTQAF